MHFTLLCSALWATFALSLTVDTTGTGNRGKGLTFTLKQHAIERQRPWSPARSVLKAHLKYNIPIPQIIQDAADLVDPEIGPTGGEVLPDPDLLGVNDVPTPAVGAVPSAEGSVESGGLGGSTEGNELGGAVIPITENQIGCLGGDALDGAALAGDGRASVPAMPFRSDQMYVVNVLVGKANMSLDIDTGSSDLWVVSTLQPAAQRGSRPANRIYDPSTSGGKPLEGHTWRMSYGDQSTASGQVYLDKVAIGDLVVPNQAVEAASTMSQKFIQDAGHDGLFGFGSSRRNAIRPEAQLTWFDNIRPKLASPLFTSLLKRRAAGSFDFGYIDKAKYTGEIVWAPVTAKRGYWDFTPTGFAIGDMPVQSATFEAIADTGSSLWYLPRAIADAYWAQVPGSSYSQPQSGFIFPCNSKLPDMTVIISGKRITVPGIMMNYQTLSPNTCMGGINRDFGMPFSIFGDAFLKGLFVVYEAPMEGQLRLGFASQK